MYKCNYHIFGLQEESELQQEQYNLVLQQVQPLTQVLLTVKPFTATNIWHIHLRVTPSRDMYENILGLFGSGEQNDILLIG